MTYKCKICGGNMKLVEGSSTALCEYCGTMQTVPSADNEKKLTLFSRANRLRIGCEFDKASGVYEAIVADFPEEAEAYWGLVLCKYGIEYVDDPATGKKIPTCHRSSFNSIMEDEDFEQTLENADTAAKKLYREEAKTIEDLRKGIISVSAQEDPYDIFICYKETDENGNRTLDSVLAQDIYDALTEKKYRVFFARITLEDKLGQEYEPYIFAALNSAKVMLAIGTDYEYYNAVWVKNEWSRYLKLMAEDHNKHLIPCYKGIDAYDMPKEFAKLQAQDLGKVGAMQDLLRGIDKLISPAKKEKVVVTGSIDIVDDTLKRAYSFLNAEDWNSAKKCLDTVLGYDPQNVSALIGCLMQKLRIPQERKLADYNNILAKEEYYNQAIQFADATTKAQLEEYNRSSIYNFAISQSKLAGGVALSLAIQNLESIAGWRDADDQVQILKDKQAKSRKLRTRIIAALAAVVVLAIAVKLFIDFKASYLDPLGIYKDAVVLMEQKDYLEAVEMFSQIENFKDSKDQISQCKYLYAQSLLDSGDYEGAEKAFNDLSNYMDSGDKADEAVYLSAQQLFAADQLEAAQKLYKKLGDYKDSAEKADEAGYLRAQQLLAADQLEEAQKLYKTLGDYKDSAEQSTQIGKEIAYRKGVAAFQTADSKTSLNSVVTTLSGIADYKDAQQYIYEAQYKLGNLEYDQENHKEALGVFLKLKQAGYTPGADRLSVIEQEIYAKAKDEYDKTNWGTAKKWFEKLDVTGYSNSAAMVGKCSDNITKERSSYDGIYTGFYYFKISDGVVYYTAFEADYHRGNWEQQTSTYDEDTGILSFRFWTDDEYDVYINGNALTFKWTNPEDQWDTDALSGDTYYRK